MTDNQDYFDEVEVNQRILETELEYIAKFSQGAAAEAWNEIRQLPLDRQKAAIRRALSSITREHGQSAMVAAQDNMEAHIKVWARQRGSSEGLPDKIHSTHPLGDKSLDKFTEDIYKRLQDDTQDAQDTFFRLISNTITNRARNVVVNTCRRYKTRFYRVPERRACWFCLMLASRGAVYYSEYTAGKGHKYHAHCRCTVRAVLPGDTLPPIIQTLQNIPFSTPSEWKNGARDGQLSKAIHSHGYQVIRGLSEIPEDVLAKYPHRLDTVEKRDLYRRQLACWSEIPDGEFLKDSEVSFLEAFEARGERVVWQSSDVRDAWNRKIPSYDFEWVSGDGQLYELKTPQQLDTRGRPKTPDAVLKSAAKLVTSKKNEAYRKHGFKKTRFMVNLQDLDYDVETDKWLASINRRPGEPKITELVVFAGGEIIRVPMR